MNMSIKSRMLGKTVTFSRPGSRYIFVDLNGQPGNVPLQVMHKGSSVDYAGDDPKEFGRVCRNWYRNYVNQMRELGLLENDL